MFFFDTVSAGKPRRTADGYLVADARVARTGIQEYLGKEVGKPDMPIVRVFRPEAEVFAQDSMSSYAHKPVTNNHPAKLIDAESWRAHAIGTIGGEVQRDGAFIRVPLALMDAQAIRDFESGKRELSMGYTSELVFGDGTTPDGEAYDAIQTNIRINHLALVDRARGGAALRIGDRTPNHEDSSMSNITTKTVLVDGLQVETTDAGAQAISKLQGDIATHKQALADANTAHASALATKDAELARKDAEIDSLKGKVLTDAQIDAKVKQRADLIGVARAIHDADYTGKSDAEIRRAVVVAKLGDSVIAGKPEAYVDARFDILADEASADPVRKALLDGSAAATNDAEPNKAYEKMVQDMRTAHQTATK